MKDRFRLGVRELMGIWEAFLPGEVTAFLNDICERRDVFHIPDEIWVRIIYCFAIAAHRQVMSKEHLLKSLTPLYIGKTASFVEETLESDARDVEEKIDRLCTAFEENKHFIVENWN
jgi:hypothetical protein